MGCIGALIFIAVSIGLTMKVREYLKARDAIRTPARIESLKIFNHKGRSPTTSMVASYSYQWEGRQFTSKHLGIFVERWDLRLLMMNAFEKGGTVDAWVDPSDPSYSVIDREWQWSEFIAFVGLQIFGVWMAFYCFSIARYGPKPLKKKRHFGKPLLRLP